MQYALVNEDGIIENLIVYDGKSSYQPDTGLSLELVNSWIGIGMHRDDPQPQPITDESITF